MIARPIRGREAPLAVLLLLLTLVGCGSLPPDVARAKALFDQRSYGEARDAAVRAKETSPDHPVAWRVAIQSSYNLGQADLAMSDYRAWYERRAGHDRVLLERLALTTLWQALRVPSSPVRVLAIQAIERLEVEKLARDVDARMTDDSDVVAAAAAVAILRSSPSAPRIASQLLASDIPKARAIVVEGIARKVGRSARGDLLFSLRDPAPVVRAAGASAIAAMKRPADTTALIRLATSDPDPDVRIAALEGLALGRRDDAASAGTSALAAQDARVRLAGLRLLDKLGERAPLERLASDPSATHDAPWLALHARILRAAPQPATSATSADTAAWNTLFERASAHPSWQDPAIRAATARALAPARRDKSGPVPTGIALAWLAPMRLDSDARVRVAATETALRLGQEDAATQLSDACRDPDPAARQAAIQAHLDTRRLSLGLVSALADESALLRVRAAEAIRTIIH